MDSKITCLVSYFCCKKLQYFISSCKKAFVGCLLTFQEENPVLSHRNRSAGSFDTVWAMRSILRSIFLLNKILAFNNNNKKSMVLINDFWIEDYMSLVRGKMPRVTGKIVVLLKVQTVQNYMNRKKKSAKKNQGVLPST